MSHKENIEPNASVLGRALASQRRIVEGNCEICGKPFTGTIKRRFCGNTCAARAYRQRRRERAQP
jgi:hypothetical protein